MNIYRSLRAALSGHYKGHFGQYAEDCLVRKHFSPRQEKGVCLDIGAYHPFRFNNTAYFWMCGWRCVNVDANPKSIELFNKYRKSDTNIHAAVITQQEWAEGKTEVELLLPSKSDKDGLSAVGTAVLSQAPADYERVTVPSVSISQVLESNDLQNVSYINIDIEGYDEVVLLDIDLVRYRPKVITVEQFAEDVKDVANSEVARFMRDHRSVAFASQLHIHVCKGTLVRVSFEPIGSVPPLIT